jgi:hypothetical protein
MDKLKIIEIVSEKRQHYFYCDKCEKPLGFSSECEDGYYVKFGEVKERIFINKTWFNIEKTLCEECKKEFYEELIKKLESIGFKEKLEF